MKPKGIEAAKPTSLQSALLAAMVALSFLTLASATRAADPPRHPTYYSAQKPILPPMPFNPFPDLPVHQLDQWDWVYDDSQVDYEQLAREAAIVAPSSASRPFSPLDDSGPGLKISPISQGQIQLQIVNVPVGQVYDLYQRFELKGNLFTAGQCQKVGSGKNLDTFTFSSQAAGSVFYALGDQDTDQDLDGIPDAFEQCVSKRSTSSANCPRDIYEAVITAQSPSGWFRLNDGSYANAVSGHTSLMPGGVGGGFDIDVLANGNSAYLFSQPSANLSLAEDAIGGGTGDPVSQGSFTLLFRALTGQATGKRYLFSQGNSLNNNNALAVYFDGTGAAGALKVAVGNTQVAPQQLREEIILQDLDIARGAWYYLAVTCDQARANNQVRWYLGRVGSGTLQSGSFTLATSSTVFGDGGTITVGNKGGSTISAYQSPGNGYIDQVAFWKRELAADEIAAQFNRLTALFQGPSAVFDLTHWELTLPVDNLNQLDNTHLPLDIGTAWLNSGFKYIDPSTCTKKYFYRDANTMVFEVPYNGADQDLTSPSSNLGSPRSELRGTLVNGSEDNWQPLGTHILEATCTVDAVNLGSGKVIIGQIHEKTPTDVASIVVNYNYPNAQDVSVTVKDNADGTDNPLFDPGNKDRNITLASGVPLRATIHYKVELVGTANSLTLTATFNNGTPQSRTMYQNGDPIWSDSTWLTSYFYFKAGCYFPHAPLNSSAKVTFSSF